MHRKEILAEKQILMSVTIEVGSHERERRGQRSLPRETTGDEVIAAIEKDHGLHLRHAHLAGQPPGVAVDLRQRGFRVAFKGSIALAQRRHRRAHQVERLQRQQTSGAGLGVTLHDLRHAIGEDRAMEHAHRLGAETFVTSVPSPVGRREIHPSVPIKVTRRHSVPPAHHLAQRHPTRAARCGGNLHRSIPRGEPPLVVSINPDRPEVAGQHKLGSSVVIQIGEDRARHLARRRKRLAGQRIDREGLAVAAKQKRVHRLRVTPGTNPSAHEKIEDAVAIHIRHRERAPARFRAGQAVVHRVGGEVVDSGDAAGGLAILVVRGAGDDSHRPVPASPAQDRRLIARDPLAQRRGGQRGKAAVGLIDEDRQASSLAAPDHQVIPAISVDIEPRHAGPELAQASRQRRLQGKIVERLFVVRVLENSRNVGEQRGFGGDGGARRRLGSSLVHDAKGVGLHVGQDAAAAAAPGDFDGQKIGQGARRKDAQRLIPGQVTAARDHLLALHRHRAAAHHDARSDALGVGRAPLQLHRHPRGRGLVLQQRGRRIEVVDHHVEIAIVVEIRHAHALGNGLLIEAPFLAGLGELQVAQVPEGKVRSLQLGEHGAQPQLLLRGHGPRFLGRLDAAHHVHVHAVPGEAIGDEHVLISIQIHVEKDRGPRPFGGLEAAEARRLRPRPVASGHEQCVPRSLRAVGDSPDGQNLRLDVDPLAQPVKVPAAEHVQDEEVIVTIAVQIGEIDAHRGERGLAERQRGQRTEPPAPVIHPDAIGRFEIVADVEIRRAIAREIAKHHRQSPIIRRRGQRLARLVQKGAIRPTDRGEVSAAIVAQQHIRLPVLIVVEGAAGRGFADSEGETRSQCRVRHRHPVDADHLRAAINVAQGKARVRLVANGDRPIVADIAVEIAIAIHVGQRQRHAPRS